MYIKKLQLIFIFCLGGSVAGYASTVVSITNNADRIELHWPSLVNQTYEILVSTNFVEEFTSAHQVQARHPKTIGLSIRKGTLFFINSRMDR